MIWQWLGLALFSVTLLPAGVALLAGRVPRRLRRRPELTRPRGVALLAFCAVAPLNAVPRLAGASASVTLAATALAGAVAVGGCVALMVTPRRARTAAR
ncbi:hypothetical protein ACIHCM_02815 [Streptomyces sp. NPDC052023]|uniref:hypothetical protein n=1 Tax=Streptomyces sp. NPDC052023 TaxID=3365681 RepID=UPI0037CDE5D3